MGLVLGARQQDHEEYGQLAGCTALHRWVCTKRLRCYLTGSLTMQRSQVACLDLWFQDPRSCPSQTNSRWMPNC